MTDPSQQASATPNDGGTTQDGPPGMPRWVKVSAIVTGLLVVLVVVALAVGGGNHGPGRHGGDDGGSPATAPEGHTPPEGGHGPPPGGH
jgi:hypothetical protein